MIQFKQFNPNCHVAQIGKSLKQVNSLNLNLKIHPFSVPHDAYDPVGFYFEWGSDDLFDPHLGSLAWVTDLGFVPTLVRERIRKAKILVLESNYCPQMLEADTKRDHGVSSRG